MAGILGCILGLLFLPPLVSLVANGIHAGVPVLAAIGIDHLSALVLKTASLAILATVWATILALPFAWLVVRTNIPWRSLWRWLGTIPLAIPSYIGALTYITLLGPAGLVNDVIRSITGNVTPWVTIYGFWGGVFVLGSFTYPIMFLFLTSALERTNPALEEAARSLGHGRLGVFRLVTLPLLRPTILAGGLLIFLYAISDFGALSLLRVQVLTTEIYHQLNTRFDQAAV
ncbi:MAG TPA: iron ABC transporter permease, partial [Nitrospirales bacterium]|nr:iron ABC transporter permease [Nitrospirales bacterium]